MHGASKTTLTVGGIVLAVILMIAVNILSSTAIQSTRLDLTEDKLFTVSEGTRQVIAGIDEPIHLKFYLSRALTEQSPQHASYARRVRELLEHYVRLSDGKLILSIYDPEPFSVIEDEAVAQGLFGIPLTAAGDRAYFGLTATNSTDDRETIPVFDRRRESFLEYDLTRMINNLANPDKKVVGLIETVQMQANMMSRQPAWAVLDQMRQFFEVRNLTTGVTEIPDDIDVLMIVHPRGLGDDTLYAIDQFVMRGGKVLAFVDPHAESMMLTQEGQQPGATVSDFDRMLEAWGVRMDDEHFAADADAAVRVSTRSGGRDVAARFLGWLLLDSENFNGEDVVTGQLDSLMFGIPGAFVPAEGATTTFTPLVRTSSNSALMPADRVRSNPDVLGLLADFEAAGEPLTVAVRLQGPAVSAFPDGPPQEPEEAAVGEGGAEDGGADASEAAETPPPAEEDTDGEPDAAVHLAEAQAPLNAILVADADMLADRFWINEQNFLGQRVAVPTTGNADFAINALDNLTGSQGLISLRSRGRSERPFHVIEEIQRDAEMRYRQTEQNLQQKLQETEEKMAELQSRAGPDGGAILSDEQRQAIDDFRAEMLSIRQQLREVQHALRSDIEDLNNLLIAANIWAMPILISLVALIVALVRRARHRQRTV